MRRVATMGGAAVLVLACGGLFHGEDPPPDEAPPVGEAAGGPGGSTDVAGLAPPADFTCPDGTVVKGGAITDEAQLWLPPAYPLAMEGDRWSPPDLGFEQDHFRQADLASFADGAASWWCEDDRGLRAGPFLQTDGGAVRVEGTYARGRPDGAWKGLVLEEGAEPIPLFEGSFEHGRPEGEWSWYCGPGCFIGTVAHGSFVRSRPDGVWTWTGEMMSATATFRLGVLDGPWHHTWYNGEETGQFTDGKRSGKWTVTTDGAVVSEQDYGEPVEAEAKGKAERLQGTPEGASGRRLPSELRGKIKAAKGKSVKSKAKVGPGAVKDGE